MCTNNLAAPVIRIAHRGGAGHAPENTLSAIEQSPLIVRKPVTASLTRFSGFSALRVILYSSSTRSIRIGPLLHEVPILLHKLELAALLIQQAGPQPARAWPEAECLARRGI